jgi:hypothetical protein
MSDDEKRHDAADWLASQFGGDDDEQSNAVDERETTDEREATDDKTPDAAGGSTGSTEAPSPPAPWRAAVPPSATEPPSRFELSTPPATTPIPPAPVTPPTVPPSSPAPTTPAARTPETPPARAAGGFSWGLKPSGSTPPPEAPAVTAQPPSAEPPSTAQPLSIAQPQSVEPPAAAPAAASAEDAAVSVPPTPSGHDSRFAPPQWTTPVPPAASAPAPPVAPPGMVIPPVTPPSTVIPPVAEPTAAFPPVPPPAAAPPQSPPELVEPAAPEPQPFDSSLAGTPASDSEPRTMALPWESAGTELFTPAAAGGPIAEPATELLSGFETEAADAAAGSSVDALFGESQFRDYEADPATSQNPFVRPAAPVAVAASAPKAARAPMPRSQKTLLWIAGILAALLVLVGLFFLGTKLPRAGAVTPIATPTAKPSPTPSPTPTPAPVGPVAPGSYKWNLLVGGECLSPFDSPWAEKFTVVDCTTPHPAQLVARGTFVEPAAAATDAAAPATPAVGEQAKGSAYPGVAALQTQINLLCSAPTVINFAAAGAYSDIQFTASYPANEKQWADGDHNYYCFVSRSSGEPLTTSVAVAPAA